MNRKLYIETPDLSLLGKPREPLFDLEISVVTPMFGGSAVVRETDPMMPVRPSSVRGHLRFWWRACQGAAFKDVDDLFKAEEEIWGSTKVPTKVHLTVRVQEPGKLKASATYMPNPNKPGTFKTVPVPADGYPVYALFPFQGELTKDKTRVEIEPSQALEGVRFTLSIRLAP